MRTIRTGLSTLAALSLAGALTSSCAVNQGGSEETGQDTNTLGAHKMPLESHSPTTASAPSGAQLKYFGGPVIQNVKIWIVNWGAGVNPQGDLAGFYSTITSSAYFDWLSEYNTSSPPQKIGHGSLGGTVNDPGAPGGTVDDSTIQQEIASLISAGTLPPNDGNNLYMVYFPPGVDITQGGSQSCVQFCAYHGTFTNNGQNAYYGVIPDLGGACAGGCGDSPNYFDNLTSVSSHEMIEAVTDPGVGLATQNDAPPLGWYDDTNGEIGDICNAQQDVVAGYTVQKEFSNALDDCISQNGGSGSGSGGGTGSGSGSGSSSSGSSGGGGGGCAHDVCSAGGALDGSCDPCAASVCANDAYCCQSRWDATCISEVGSYCASACP